MQAARVGSWGDGVERGTAAGGLWQSSDWTTMVRRDLYYGAHGTRDERAGGRIS